MGSDERRRPTVRIVNAADEPVELYVGNRKINLVTGTGTPIDGIWLADRTPEGQMSIDEALAIQEARKDALALWSDDYIQGGRRALGEEYDADVLPSEVLGRLLDGRYEMEDEASLGQTLTETLVRGKLMGDPHAIAEELDGVRDALTLEHAASAHLHRDIHSATRAALPTYIETMDGSVSRVVMQRLFDSTYMAFIRDNYTS